jgi:hypothetical protein
MRHWHLRPIEVRNLFNPAFCGLVLHRALAAFQELDGRGMPFSTTLLVLPLSLHRQSREALKKGSRSYFLKVMAEHPELLVDFPRRCTDMLPYTLEGHGMLMQMGVLNVQPNGHLTVTSQGVRKSISGTDESKDAQRVAAFLGKQFAHIGHSSTIYTTMSIRP